MSTPETKGFDSNAGEGPIYPLGNCAQVMDVVTAQREALSRFPGTFDEYVASLPEGTSSINHEHLYKKAQMNASIAVTVETRPDELQAALDVLSSCGLTVEALAAYERVQRGGDLFGCEPDYVLPLAYQTGETARRRAVSEYKPDPQATEYDGPRYDDGEPLPDAFTKWQRARKQAQTQSAQPQEMVAYCTSDEPSEESEGEEGESEWEAYFKRCFEALFDVSHFAQQYLDGHELEFCSEGFDVISLRRAFEFYPEAYEVARDAFNRTLERLAKYHERNIRLYRGPLEGIEDINYNSV